MSPARHHRRRRLGGILAAGSALAIGIGVIIGNQVTGGGNVPPITGIPTNVGVANEWVNTTAGASPSRCSPACAYDSTHAYGSMGAANTAASAGDSVLFKTGTYGPQATLYTAQNSSSGHCQLAPGYPATSGTWPDGTSQAQDISGCVFFQPEFGATTTFQCTSSPCSPLTIETGRMYIKGFTMQSFCPSTTVSCRGPIYVNFAISRSGSATCQNALAEDVIVDGTTGATEWYNNGPTDNVAFINNTFGPGWDSTVVQGGMSSQTNNCNGPGTPVQTTRFLFAHNLMHDYVWPVGTGSQHAECIHLNGGNNFVYRGNQFLNCLGNPIAIQGDNQTAGNPSVTNGLFESNVFGDPCSNLAVVGAPAGQCLAIEGGGVTVRCNVADDTANLTFRFNTMVRPMDFSSSLPCTGNGFQIYGNIGTSPPSSPAYPSIWTAGYNLWTTWTGTLAPGDVKTSNSIDSLFTNDAAPTYDYTLSATGLGVDPLVPGTGSYLCAPTDAALAARPSTQCLAGAYQTNVNKGTGVPNPDCSPSACLVNVNATEFTVAGQLDSAGANAKVVSQKYWIVKPTNLVCTQAKPCALVVHSGCPPDTPTDTCINGASHDVSGWNAQSATEKYVLMYLPPTHNCASLCAYGIPAYQPIIPPNGGPNICGTNGTNVCDDVPYMKAALAATVCYGASPCQNIDPNAVFITGESKGAAWTFDMICDTRTSSIFRGASIVSESYPLRSPATNGSTGQTTQPNCPALGGLDNGYGGPVALNPDISLQWQYGTADATGCGSGMGLPSTCYDTGGVTQSSDSTRWSWSNPQLAGATTGLTAGQGQTSNGSLVTPGHAIGCNGTPTSTTTVSVHLIVTDYGGCTVSLRATETIKVVNGGHACPGLKNQTDTASYNCAATGWTFMKAH